MSVKQRFLEATSRASEAWRAGLLIFGGRAHALHNDCRMARARSECELAVSRGETLNARLALEKVKADLADLEVAIMVQGQRSGRLPEALDTVDRQRARRKRRPLGQVRDLVANETLVPMLGDGDEPSFQAPAGQRLSVGFVRHMGLLVLAVLLAAAAPAAELFLPIGLYGGGGAGDYLSTEYAGPGQTRPAPGGGTFTVYETNPLGQTRGERMQLKLATSIGFAAGDVGLQHLQSKGHKWAGWAKWALRGTYVYVTARAIHTNALNGQAVRK